MNTGSARKYATFSSTQLIRCQRLAARMTVCQREGWESPLHKCGPAYDLIVYRIM
jgi:hypothetical protein